MRTINAAFAKLTGSDPDTGVFTYPERLGYWPAALGLYAFVWMELVYPFATELGPVRLWCAVYVAAMLLGGALFGNTFYEHADPFEVFSTLVSRMSVWGAAGASSWWSAARWRTSRPRRSGPGWSRSTSVLFGSTAFDSFKDSTRWVKFIQGDFVQDNGLTHLSNNVALLAFVLAVGAGLHGRHHAHRRRARPAATGAAQTSSRTRSCRS